MQLDEFYIEEWEFEGWDPLKEVPNWVTLKNDTIVDGIFFNIAPSKADFGTRLKIKYKLTDINDRP